MQPAQPQVVAHRGSSERVPEHTLAAYLQAIDDGADALECDVRLTRDGHLVCVHDRRVDRTSNGRGPVSTKDLAELQELDWQSWKAGASGAGGGFDGGRVDSGSADGGREERPDRDGSGVLTLQRLLEAVADAPRRVEVAIETKHPTRYAGLVERRLVELLDRFGWAHSRSGDAAATPVRVMSFSQLSLRRIRLLAPSLPTVLLMERTPVRFWDGSLPLGTRIAGPGMDVVRAHPRYVARVHRQGNQVHVWTVDAPADVELCLELGVDAIITNRPNAVRALLAAA
ncbi:MAG: glycerophosphodiester phosphodiesterase [Actinomycetes bacterium]